MKAILIKTDGSETEAVPANGDTFTLEELQKYVGGYIETHGLKDGKTIILNEEGALLKLPVNDMATVLAYHLATVGGIRGDVIVCESQMLA